MTERLLSITSVMAKLDIKARSTFAKVLKQTDFPAPIQLEGLTRARFLESDVDEWIIAQARPPARIPYPAQPF